MRTPPHRRAEKWARIIAEKYGDWATPRLSIADQDRLASWLEERLADPGASDREMILRANLVLNRWERREGGEGLRVLSLDLASGVVRMGRRPARRSNLPGPLRGLERPRAAPFRP